MSFFTFIDKFLLHKVFEPISYWFQRQFGWDCFSLANFFRVLISLCALCLSVFSFQGEKYPQGVFQFSGAVIYFFFVGNWMEEVSTKVRGRGFRNHLEISTMMFFLRIIFTYRSLMVIGSLISSIYMARPSRFIDNIFVLCMWLFIYFLSCTPLPPSEGKFQKWFKSLLKKLSSEPLSEPA